MKLIPGITVIPILHGRAAFSTYIRNICIQNKFDCIAIDLPEPFSEELPQAVTQLPFISAVLAYNSIETKPNIYYIPTDPCDAAIEGIRQAQQNHLHCAFIGYPNIYMPPTLPLLPDEYTINKIGFDEYATMCIHILNQYKTNSKNEIAAQYIAHKLHHLKAHFHNILALIHFRHFIPMIDHFQQECTYNLSFPKMPNYTIKIQTINPDHLYFSLGELPFITGIYEKERYDIFAKQIDITDAIKELFRQTRDNYFNSFKDIVHLSPVRIQNGLTFLRNLTILDKNFIPSLFDIVTAAKGIGGNSYALKILKCAKYYPYFPIEIDNQYLSIGINKIVQPGKSVPDKAINLFRDYELIWKTLSIKPDPSNLRKKHFRYNWNPLGICSHLPEDSFIEHFNSHIRTKSKVTLCEDFIKTEKFETSVKDGIDIRETLRNWHTNNIYVKEIPPSRGAVDTVVIIFDEDNDDKYPQHSTWYAEHEEESTLTFYGSNPFEDMVGPGIARCTYGGLTLLFPPRYIPCIFELTKNSPLKKLSYRLTFGALQFSKERFITYIAAKKPSIFLKKIASRMNKNLLWIPLSNFSSETLLKLRRFHVLNGKQVRSWASRFIGK